MGISHLHVYHSTQSASKCVIIIGAEHTAANTDIFKNLKSLSYHLTDKIKLEEALTLTTRLEQRVRSLVPSKSGLRL